MSLNMARLTAAARSAKGKGTGTEGTDEQGKKKRKYTTVFEEVVEERKKLRLIVRSTRRHAFMIRLN